MTRVVTEAWGRIGELRHYPDRKFGTADWMCNCGHVVKIRLTQKLYVRKDNEPIQIVISHRNRERVYKSHEPDGYQLLYRLDKVCSYADCILPWRDYN